MYGDIGRFLTRKPLKQPTNGSDAMISVVRAVVHFESRYSVSCSPLATSAGNAVLVCVTALKR
jgi:hypothetical protein